jgi:hypothetical protein
MTEQRDLYEPILQNTDKTEPLGSSHCVSCGKLCRGSFCNAWCEQSQRDHFADWIARTHPEQAAHRVAVPE